MGINAEVTSVSSSDSSTTLLANNPDRKGAVIQNTSTAILYVLLNGSTANAVAAHSKQIPSNESWELPAFEVNGTSRCYTGQINGIWASANGQANITEFW